MKLSNTVYDIAKYILLVLVPAVEVLIATLGTIYGFDTEIIILTIAAFATFFGSALKISSDNYNKKSTKKVK